MAMVFCSKAQSIKKYIEYENTGIIAYANNCNPMANIVEVQIKCPLAMIDTCQDIFNISMTVIDGEGYYTCLVDVPDMPLLVRTTPIEQEDVGKNLWDGYNIWFTNLVYEYNLLKLDLNKWDLKP